MPRRSSKTNPSDSSGSRTRVVTIATTLLDPVRYPKAAIAELYGLRWEVETNVRHLKITMGLDRLKCKSVQGVLKELMIFVLVYSPCVATLAALKRETGSWKWPAFATLYTTALAFVLAVAVYQGGKLLGWGVS